MRTLRLILRLSALCLGTGFLYVLWVVGYPFAWLLRRVEDWRCLVFRNWGRWVARVVQCRIVVDGAPPSPPFLLVANHLSYLDIPFLATQLRCVFLSKADIAYWPIIGFLARSMGTLFIRREHKRDVPIVVAQIEECLGRGQGVVVFPEGTSTMGETVIRFRSSMLQPAATAGLPVHYAALSYRTLPGEIPANLSVCWWGDMPFGRHALDLLRVSGFEARIAFGPEPIQSEDRKVLAKLLHRAVLERFIPVCSPTVPTMENECVRENT